MTKDKKTKDKRQKHEKTKKTKKAKKTKKDKQTKKTKHRAEKKEEQNSEPGLTTDTSHAPEKVSRLGVRRAITSQPPILIYLFTGGWVLITPWS